MVSVTAFDPFSPPPPGYTGELCVSALVLKWRFQTERKYVFIPFWHWAAVELAQ